MISIQLFGTPQVLDEGQPVRLTRRKSRALLYFIAAHLQPVRRETLLAIFWPETRRASAQQSLRTSLYSLRQAIGDAVEADPETVGLSAGTRVDVRLFETVIDRPAAGLSELSAALDLYRGDFLGDFNLPDIQPFEEWATIEREHYRQKAVQGFVRLSAAYEADRDYAAALSCLDRALALNPLQENLHRDGIRLAYLAGDRPEAVLRYDKLRRLLAEEFGMPPMPETRELYDAIINDRLPSPASGSQRSTQPVTTLSSAPQSARRTVPPAQTDHILPFVGRETELKTLRELTPTHKLLLIEGEPGIGKTRLAEEFILASTAQVLVGRARELEQALPYQPIIEALRTLTRQPAWHDMQTRLQADLPVIWLQETSRLLPELFEATDPAGTSIQTAYESRLWEGVNQFLATLARQQPVILFLDDLHWADASTLALLGYLVRQLRTAPVSFLATAQPARAGSALKTFLQSLIRDDRLAHITLPRLNLDEVRAVAQTLSPKSPSPLARWLQENSEGNPYILAELVREARSRGILDTAGKFDAVHLSESPVVPRSIYSLIQSRLARLSGTARRMLDVAVAAGREFDFEVVAQAAGLADQDAFNALEELANLGLIHELEGAHFLFDHTLTMEVAYRELGEARHRMLHRQVAEALQAIHRSNPEPVAGLLAWHFTEGNDLKRASPYAFQAGQRAARLAAWTEAISFFQQALAGAADDRRLPIWIALGEAQLRAGHFVQSSEVYRDALHWAQTHRTEIERVKEIQLALARSLVAQARFAEVVSLAKQVRSSGHRKNAVNAELLWGTALSLEGSDLDGAAEHLRAAEALYRSGSEPEDAELGDLAQIKFELGSVLAQKGDLQQAVALYREALSAAEKTESNNTLEQRILAYNNLAYHLLLLSDPSAVEYAQAGLRLSEEKGIMGLQPYLYSTLGEIALAQGDLDQAEANFLRGLDIAERLTIPERIAGLTANLGLVAAKRGQTELAIHRLSTALGQADSLSTHHLAAQIRLWLVSILPQEEAQAQLAEARAIAEAGGRRRLLEEAERLEARLKRKAAP